MATDVSVRIASTTNHGNLRFSPRVAKRARSSGSAFLCPWHTINILDMRHQCKSEVPVRDFPPCGEVSPRDEVYSVVMH